MTDSCRTVTFWRLSAVEWEKLSPVEKGKWESWTGEVGKSTAWYHARAWDMRQGDVRGANLG